MAIQVIEPSPAASSLLSAGESPQILRVELPGAFDRGSAEATPGFFSLAVETPAQGLPAPNFVQVPEDPVACFVSNGVDYCRTAVTYCENGVEKTLFVLASTS